MKTSIITIALVVLLGSTSAFGLSVDPNRPMDPKPQTPKPVPTLPQPCQ